MSALSGRTPEPRRAQLAELSDPETGIALDRALTLFFPGPASATGEDVAEFHLHGGRAVVAAVENALASLPGLRRAEAGEFTRRAFANGRLDLTEAEGLSDLLMAETESQRRNAMALADGALSRAVRGWRNELLGAAALIEARIDFADEDDVPDYDGVGLEGLLRVRSEIAAMLHCPPAERLRDGIRVILAGPPNVGKSTLLNALVGRQAAITTPLPGTTRDLIEVPVQIEGVPFILVDSAGLRATEDSIEAIGIGQARQAIDAADVVLWLGDAGEAPAGAINLRTKADLLGVGLAPAGYDLSVSAVTGAGLVELRRLIVSRGTSLLPREGEVALAQRQRAALSEAATALALVGEGVADIVLVAETIRAAGAALDRLTGEGGIEPLLDAIFSQFCIGK
jgi:tRNA modification GTPase